MPEISTELPKLEAEFKEAQVQYNEEAEVLSTAIAELKEAQEEVDRATNGTYNSDDEKQAAIKTANKKRLEGQQALDAISIQKICILIITHKLKNDKIKHLREIAIWNGRREKIQLFQTALQLINARVISEDDPKTSWYQTTPPSRKGHLELEDASTVLDEKGNSIKDSKGNEVEKFIVDLKASRINGKENLRALLTKLKNEEGCEINLNVKEFDKNSRDALITNLQQTMGNLTLDNNISIEKMQQCISEHYESFQFARAIMKCLHEANQQTARGIKG